MTGRPAALLRRGVLYRGKLHLPRGARCCDHLPGAQKARSCRHPGCRSQRPRTLGLLLVTGHRRASSWSWARAVTRRTHDACRSPRLPHPWRGTARAGPRHSQPPSIAFNMKCLRASPRPRALCLVSTPIRPRRMAGRSSGWLRLNFFGADEPGRLDDETAPCLVSGSGARSAQVKGTCVEGRTTRQATDRLALVVRAPCTRASASATTTPNKPAPA